MTCNELSISESLDRLRAKVHTEADLLLLAFAYDNLTDPARVNEHNLRAEGFEFLEDDTSVMWILGVGPRGLDVCYSMRGNSLEVEAMPVKRGRVSIGEVRLLLKALGHQK